MLVKRYNLIPVVKPRVDWKIRFIFVLIRRPNEPNFSTKFMISKVYLVL